MSRMIRTPGNPEASPPAARQLRNVDLLELGISTRLELLHNPAISAAGRTLVEDELLGFVRQLEEGASLPRQQWPENFAPASLDCIKALVKLPQQSAQLRGALRSLRHTSISTDTKLLKELRQRGPTYGLPDSQSQLLSMANCSCDSKIRDTARSMLVAYAMLKDSPAPAGPQSVAVQTSANQTAVSNLTAAIRACVALRPPELTRKLKLKSVPQLAEAGWSTFAHALRSVAPGVREAPPLRVSLLEAPDGRSWVVSNRFAHGSAGKCRIAVPVTGVTNGNFEPVAIKELRRNVPARPGASADTRRRRPVTDMTTDSEAKAEFEQLKALHGNGMALDMVTTAKSNFIIQTLMDTDATDLINTITFKQNSPAQGAQLGSLRFYLFVEAGLQLSKQLAAWHAKSGGLCPDIKPDNILVHRSGSIWLADIGTQGVWDRRLGLFKGGTFTPQFLAPEVLLHEGRTQADDVWALCVSLLMMVLPGEGPFYGASSPERIGPRYARWHDAMLRDEQGLIDPADLQKDSFNDFERYFAKLATLHPNTADVFVNYAMNPRREKRISAQNLADWFQSEGGPPRNPQAIRQFLTEAAEENADRKATVTALQTYAEVLKTAKK
jgi:hypothetical protein